MTRTYQERKNLKKVLDVIKTGDFESIGIAKLTLDLQKVYRISYYLIKSLIEFKQNIKKSFLYLENISYYN